MANAEDDLMAAVGLNNERLKERSSAVQSIYEEQSDASARTVAAASEGADARMIVTAARQIATNKAATQTLDTATALGSNADSSSYIMNKLADEWRTSTNEAIDARKTLKKTLDVNFLDTPLDWVAAQFHLPYDVKRAEASTQRVQGVAVALNQAQAITQSAAQTNLSLSSVQSAAEMQANLDATKAALDVTVQDARIKAAGVNLRGIQDLNAMDSAQISNYSTAANIQYRKEDRARADAQFALQKKQTALNMQLTQQSIDKNNLDAQGNKDIANLVKVGANLMNNTAFNNMTDSKIISMAKLSPAVQEFLKVGMNSVGTNTPVVSNSAGEAAAIMHTTGSNLAPHQSNIQEVLLRSLSEAAKNPNAMGINGPTKHDVSNKDAVSAAATSVAMLQAKKHMGEIDVKDKTNLYSAPDLDQIVKIPAIANSAFGAKVLAPQMAAGGLREFQPQQIMSMLTDAVQSKKLTVQEAAQGGFAMFNAVPVFNNSHNNYRGFGLPDQVGMNVRVKNPNWNTTEVVDMTNEKEFRRVFNRALSASTYSRQLGFGNK